MINMKMLISGLVIGMLLITGLTATATTGDKITKINSQKILELAKFDLIKNQIGKTLESF